METVKQYREIIQRLIRDYAQYRSARGEVQVEVIFDEANPRPWPPDYRAAPSFLVNLWCRSLR
jgi:hypothetical protein